MGGGEPVKGTKLGKKWVVAEWDRGKLLCKNHCVLTQFLKKKNTIQGVNQPEPFSSLALTTRGTTFSSFHVVNIDTLTWLMWPLCRGWSKKWPEKLKPSALEKVKNQVSGVPNHRNGQPRVWAGGHPSTEPSRALCKVFFYERNKKEKLP